MQPYMQAAPVAAQTSAVLSSSAPQVAPQSAPNSTISHELVGGVSRSAPTTGGHVNGADKASLVSCKRRHTRVSSSGMCEQKTEAHRHRGRGGVTLCSYVGDRSRSAPTWGGGHALPLRGGGCHALLLRGGSVTLCSYVGGGCHSLLLRQGGM
jgi:hypothetical protein